MSATLETSLSLGEEHFPGSVPNPYPAAEYLAAAVCSQAAEVADELNEFGLRTYSLPVTDNPLAEQGYELWEKDDTTAPGAVHTTPNGKEVPVGTFKLRGAAAALLLARKRLQNTFRDSDPRDPYPQLGTAYAASRGNHAAGVAFAGPRVGFRQTVIETAVGLGEAKQELLDDLGAVVNSANGSLEDARAKAREGGSFYGNVCIEPFDSIDTMAGARSAAEEILADFVAAQAAGNLDLHNDEITVLLPGGGGGLAAAASTVFYEARQQGLIGQNLRVVMVQVQGNDALTAKIQGKSFDPDTLDTACEGTAVVEPGLMTSEIIADERFVQEALVVSPNYVSRAMRYAGYPAEPAGMLALAGAMWLADQQGVPQDGRRHILHTMRTGKNITSTDFADYVHEHMTPTERAEAVKRMASSSIRFEDDELDEEPASDTWRGNPTLASPTGPFRSALVAPWSRR